MARPRAVTGVIFDFDGTVVDLPVDWDACKRELAELAGRMSSLASSATVAGLVSAIREAHGEAGRAEAFGILRRFEVAALASMRSYSEVVAAIRDEAEPRFALVSANSREIVVEALGRLGLADRFRAVIGREDVSVPKPAPEGLGRGCERLGLPPECCVYVGDREIDQLAASAAGTNFVWAAGLRDELGRANRRGTSLSLREVCAMLLEEVHERKGREP